MSVFCLDSLHSYIDGEDEEDDIDATDFENSKNLNVVSYSNNILSENVDHKVNGRHDKDSKDQSLSNDVPGGDESQKLNDELVLHNNTVNTHQSESTKACNGLRLTNGDFKINGGFTMDEPLEKYNDESSLLSMDIPTFPTVADWEDNWRRNISQNGGGNEGMLLILIIKENWKRYKFLQVRNSLACELCM